MLPLSTIAFGESAARLCRPHRREAKVHGRNLALNYSLNGWRMASNLSRQGRFLAWDWLAAAVFEFIAQSDADNCVSTNPTAIRKTEQQSQVQSATAMMAFVGG